MLILTQKGWQGRGGGSAIWVTGAELLCRETAEDVRTLWSSRYPEGEATYLQNSSGEKWEGQLPEGSGETVPDLGNHQMGPIQWRDKVPVCQDGGGVEDMSLLTLPLWVLKPTASGHYLRSAQTEETPHWNCKHAETMTWMSTWLSKTHSMHNWRWPTTGSQHTWKTAQISCMGAAIVTMV